jgi:uncharacterized membrane protein
VQDEPVLREATRTGDERLTSRLEAFGDLVFGFSLSLIALRLDVPSRVEELFEPTRWVTVVITFALICRFWLEHYRIFRHRFVVRTLDMVVNFVFLFGIAILPYAVQTFLRFQMQRVPFSIYIGDVVLVLTTLSILRTRGLRQRRGDPDEEGRLSDWRRTVAQFAVAVMAAGLLGIMHRAGANFQTDVKQFGSYAVPGIVVIGFLVRRAVRGLPAFLKEEG